MRPVDLRGLRVQLARDVEAAAQALLGAFLVRDDTSGQRVGRIVEVEAYDGPDDRASHARFGRTRRNGVMFGPPGVAYVYLVYGMYSCLNVVTGPDGSASACLIRAVEPVAGVDAMREARVRYERSRRRRSDPKRDVAAETRLRVLPPERLASGPGLVAAAFGIDRALNGLDLCDPASPLRFELAGGREARALDHLPVVRTARLGIDYAGPPWTEVPWRFAIDGNPAVSGRSRTS
ncbi:MAG TPA: DNA-3-methyladenine glycosylase [Candidatus Limnocylindrales bacterium]